MKTSMATTTPPTEQTEAAIVTSLPRNSFPPASDEDGDDVLLPSSPKDLDPSNWTPVTRSVTAWDNGNTVLLRLLFVEFTSMVDLEALVVMVVL